MSDERFFKDCRVRVNPQHEPQVSYDDGVTWEDIDCTEVIQDIHLEMNGEIKPEVTKRFQFSKLSDPTKW